MIQRKQTLWLLLALAVGIVCLCLPIGVVQTGAMGQEWRWYNLGIYSGKAFAPQPVPFVDLVIMGTLTFIDIFLYKHRRMQMGICNACIVLCVIWYGYYTFCALGEFASMGSFHPRFAACLPLIAIIALVMAHRGIKHDEDLIKSMDRIR